MVTTPALRQAQEGALGHSDEQVAMKWGGSVASWIQRKSRRWRSSASGEPEVDSSTPLRPRVVNDLRKASQKRMAQKTLHRFSQMKAPGRHRAGRVARPCIYPGRPSCGTGGMGLLGPGVCGLGGADTLNIGCSLWQDCPRIVPLCVRSAADQGDSIPTLISNDRFSTMSATDGSSALACRMAG